MYLKLRVIFTILAALCAAAVLPLGAFFGFIWAAVAILGAFAFYFAMLFFKQQQESLTPPTEAEQEKEQKETERDNPEENA